MKVLIIFTTVLLYDSTNNIYYNIAMQHFSHPPTRGLRAFGTIYAGWGLSPTFYREEEFLRQEVGDYKDLEDFLERG